VGSGSGTNPASSQVTSQAVEDFRRKIEASFSDDPQACSIKGHVFSPDLIKFKSGSLLTFCADCGDRLSISWIPGGGSAIRARWVAEQLLAHDEPTPRDFAMIDEALAQLDSDVETIEESRDSLSLARRVLEARMR